MRGALEKTCIWDNLLVERIIFLPVFSKFGASKLFNATKFKVRNKPEREYRISEYSNGVTVCC